MEIRINKEIKEYHESLFFGLSARQLVCSVFAVGIAVGIYFGLGNVLDREITSWLCVLCVAPVGLAGFFKYNGMNLEQFLRAAVYSEFLAAGVRKFKSTNYLYEVLIGGKQNDHLKTQPPNHTENRAAIHSHRRCLQGRNI